jgi:post-segregation antitoxin (ccd killing protein)
MATLRINLTIPADLKEELSKYPDINCSFVATAALRRALEERKRGRSLPDLYEIDERLRRLESLAY